MDYSSDNSLGMTMILLIVVAIMPVALIWSLNTLFHTVISYGYEEYFAALVLVVLTRKLR